MDKRIRNGGARQGAGAPKKDENHRKVTVPFQIMQCHKKEATAEIKALIATKYSSAPVNEITTKA